MIDTQTLDDAVHLDVLSIQNVAMKRDATQEKHEKAQGLLGAVGWPVK